MEAAQYSYSMASAATKAATKISTCSTLTSPRKKPRSKMPSQSLTTSIREPGQHFGGVSLRYFTNVSDLSDWTNLPGTLELLTVDQGILGSAQFRTTVEITVDTL